MQLSSGFSIDLEHPDVDPNLMIASGGLKACRMEAPFYFSPIFVHDPLSSYDYDYPPGNAPLSNFYLTPTHSSQEQISLPGRVPGPCPKVVDEGLTPQQVFRKLPAGRASRFLAMQQEAMRASGKQNPAAAAIPESLQLELTQADVAVASEDDRNGAVAVDQNPEEEEEEGDEIDGEIALQ